MSRQPRHLGSATPVPGVNWVNMHGPEVDGLDVEVLTRMEMNHRKFIWRNMQKTRDIPGYEKVYLVETAPQLGVRITRAMHGTKTITLQDLKAGTTFPDVVGVGGASDGEHGPWQIPYGALVPEKIDNVLAAGRCISAEMRMADLVRLIPNCFVTGHAAGVGAAVAARVVVRPATWMSARCRRSSASKRLISGEADDHQHFAAAAHGQGRPSQWHALGDTRRHTRGLRHVAAVCEGHLAVVGGRTFVESSHRAGVGAGHVEVGVVRLARNHGGRRHLLAASLVLSLGLSHRLLCR